MPVAAMRVHDTATGRPCDIGLAGEPLRLYVCGITPYDSAHLGHAFTYHVFDVLTRRLRHAGREVRSVRNITDVDDDILRVARQRGRDFRDLGDEWVRRFDQAMAALRILPVDAAPRATTHVPLMAEWVERLVDSGFAYAHDGWVFFDTSRFEGYGRLSGLDGQTMLRLAAERGADTHDPRKRSPLDFVLWQRSVDGEPSWPSRFGAGRPGWHIECSVMSVHDLGHPLDIHGGGDDLVFPHHESELAQAKAVGLQPFVRHWVHVAMVAKDGEKMSKSLGNLVFVDDLVRDSPAPAVRLMLAQHHYRASWHFDPADLARAEDRWRSYDGALRSVAAIPSAEAAAITAEFLERVDDDLDTPGALGVIDRAAVRAASPGGEVSLADTLRPLLSVLGVED